MAALASRRLAARPWRLLAALPLFLAALLAPPQTRLRARLNRAIVEIALRGMTRSSYNKLATGVAHELASGADVIHRAVNECRAAMDRGPTAVVTASEDVLARAYLDAIGLGGVRLIASKMDFTPHPRLVSHNVGSAKVAAARAAGFDVGNATFYTDSASDVPLARQAGTTIIVNAGNRSGRLLRASARRAVSVRWH